jgi:hypothetical protein
MVNQPDRAEQKMQTAYVENQEADQRLVVGLAQLSPLSRCLASS